MNIFKNKTIKHLAKKALLACYNLLCFIFLNPAAMKLLEFMAKYGYGSNRCLKKGFLPMPVHYYSPIPDIEDLKKRKIWAKESTLAGIDFNIKNQLLLLDEIGKNFGAECDWPVEKNKEYDFFTDNGSFGYGCAVSAHGLIRKYKPKKVIEIGSGFSSIIITDALKINKKQTNKKYDYTIIDPFPSAGVLNKRVKYNRLIKKGVELTDLEIFTKLGKNDILFIDSSHVSKIGNDVNFLFLDVLPHLKPGVIVHVHDIALPKDYSQSYFTKETFRQFWTEQYLLQSFLIYNSQFEVLLAMDYIMSQKAARFKKAFKTFDEDVHKDISGSFWMRRRLNGKN